jgi:cbb3-type cytochrome oxidase subunit 1
MGPFAAGESAASLPLAAEHFAAATLFLVAGGLGLVWVAPELAGGVYLSPRVAGVTHLFTLGWLTTTIFGALYQLLPVALGTPLRSERLGHVSFWLFAPGVALFSAGIATVSTALHHAGIALISSGILVVAANVAATLHRASARDVTWTAVALAVCFLVATLGLGVILLHNLHTGMLGDRRLAFLAAHLHVALVGWVLLLVVGMSHRLLPMFLVAHGADTAWSRRAATLLAFGVPLLAAGLLLGLGALAWAGVAALEAGFGCFLLQVRRFYRARVPPAGL